MSRQNIKNMKTHFLFPHKFKRTGWFLLIPGILLGLLYLILGEDEITLRTKVFALFHDQIFEEKVWFGLVENNILDELILILVIVGGILVAFSREKNEDEFIAKIRLESLVWATYVNYAVLLFTIIFLYGMPFFWAMIFNMFTILFFFVFRFKRELYKQNRLSHHEE